MIPTLFGITLLTFCIMQLVPGDPADVYFSPDGGEVAPDTSNVVQAVEQFRRAYLLDQPIWRQYLHYLGPFDLSTSGHTWFGGSGETPYGGLLVGDLGREIGRPHVEVSDELLRRLGVTIPLAFLALALSYGLALPLAILSAMRRGSARAPCSWLVAAWCGCSHRPTRRPGIHAENA